MANPWFIWGRQLSPLVIAFLVLRRRAPAACWVPLSRAPSSLLPLSFETFCQRPGLSRHSGSNPGGAQARASRPTWRQLPHCAVEHNATGYRILASDATGLRNRRSHGVWKAATPSSRLPENGNPRKANGYAIRRMPPAVASDATLPVSANVAQVCRRPCRLSRGNPSFLTAALNVHETVRGVQRAAVGAGEDQVVVLPGLAKSKTLLELPGPVCTEQSERCCVENDDPAASFGLGRGPHPAHAVVTRFHFDDRIADGQAPGREVELWGRRFGDRVQDSHQPGADLHRALAQELVAGNGPVSDLVEDDVPRGLHCHALSES